MSHIVTLWVELDDQSIANSLAQQVRDIAPDGAIVDVQEHMPYVPDEAPADEPSSSLGADV